jgi:hypothetical protein
MTKDVFKLYSFGRIMNMIRLKDNYSFSGE